MKITTDFAILAPVPEEHLLDGLSVCATEGEVAFGSGKWELFRTIDEMRGDAAVPVLIYPSHEDGDVKLSFTVQWAGLYVRHVPSKLGAHPDKMRFRPDSTAKYPSDNKGHWAIFWHVAQLAHLPKAEWLAISDLETIKGGWRKNAPPRGPEFVAMPSTIEMSKFL